jgi:DNA-binding MarR family transcriptional regulator
MAFGGSSNERGERGMSTTAVGEGEVAASLLAALTRAREVFQQQDVQVQTLVAFLEVARLGGECTMQQVEEAVGLSQSATSRQIQKLSGGLPREAGLGFIEAFEDPEWRRRKLVRLTGKGRSALHDILQEGVKWFNAPTTRRKA